MFAKESQVLSVEKQQNTSGTGKCYLFSGQMLLYYRCTSSSRQWVKDTISETLLVSLQTGKAMEDPVYGICLSNIKLGASLKYQIPC